VQAESRREETAVLQLAGAANSFIVRPYAYAGSITLGLGAALALAIAAAGTMVVEPRIAALAATFGQDFLVAFPPAWLLAAIVLSSVALGLVAAAVAARAAVTGANYSR
jgi:cell division transport system permease protein